jgi:hypothetical protein
MWPWNAALGIDRVRWDRMGLDVVVYGMGRLLHVMLQCFLDELGLGDRLGWDRMGLDEEIMYGMSRQMHVMF